MRRLSQIALADVDLEDDIFRSSLDRDPCWIKESIRKVGLQVPITLQAGDRGYRIVSGFLRVEAALALGLSQIEAYLRPQGDALETLLSSLHENRFTRGFSWVERTWILQKAQETLSISRHILRDEFLPALGLEPSEKVLKQHLEASRIPLPTRRKLAMNGCSFANAVRISSMDSQAQEAVADLLGWVHLTESGLRECLELMGEIALRDQISITELIQDPAFWEELDRKGYNRIQKGQALRDRLRELRMPHLSSLRRRFQQAQSALRLPRQISVETDPFFERKLVSITIRTTTPEEFQYLAQRLWKASLDGEALRNLFSSLG